MGSKFSPKFLNPLSLFNFNLLFSFFPYFSFFSSPFSKTSHKFIKKKASYLFRTSSFRRALLPIICWILRTHQLMQNLSIKSFIHRVDWFWSFSTWFFIKIIIWIKSSAFHKNFLSLLFEIIFKFYVALF